MLQEEPSLHASSLVLNYPDKSDQKKQFIHIKPSAKHPLLLTHFPPWDDGCHQLLDSDFFVGKLQEKVPLSYTINGTSFTYIAFLLTAVNALSYKHE